MKNLRHYWFFVVTICLIFGFSVKSVNSFGQKIMHEPPVKVDTNLVIPPSWAFGILYGGYTNQHQTIERVKNIITHDYPIDAYWIDSWFWSFADKGKGPRKYIDFVADTIDFPNRSEMWTFLEDRNIKGGFWVWDCIMQNGNEAAFEDFNSKGFFKNTYYEKNSWHNNSTTTAMYDQGNSQKGTLCGNINFDDKHAVDYFKIQMKHFFDEGADFIKLDRTSAINVCKAVFEMSQEFGKETKGRGFILSHAGGMENEEYLKYPTKWTDDTRSDWTIEKPEKNFNFWVPKIAFKENIAMYTSPKYKSSKIPFLTNDLGGFDMGITDKLDEELFIRWMQFSIFTPIVELFSQPENPTSNLPYLYSARADSLFKAYSHLRMQLFPYIYSYAHQRRLAGEQMMQTLPGQTYEYFFGKELFIAPVYEKGAVSKSLTLPQGRWIHYQANIVYDGGIEIKVEAPIEQIPVFVKLGAIIPLREYSRSIESGNNDTLNLHIFPGADNKFSLIEDDGSSNDYMKGSYLISNFELKEIKSCTKLILHPASGYYKGISDNRVWKILVHGKKKVQSVTLNGKAIIFKKIDDNLIETSFVESNKFKETEFIIKY